MKTIDRVLLAALVAGIWMLVALQLTATSHAQDAENSQAEATETVQVIHATDIVGLSAFVQQAIRDHQYRPQSMPGLDQYIRSVVRNCRVNGVISGGNLTATSLSC